MNYKKAFIVSVLILLLTPPSAACAENEASSVPVAGTELQQEYAQMLYDLGLFRGTDKGFELERTLTRAEAAVMFTRLLGAEEEALSKDYFCPFYDVPGWAQPYVGWLYKNRLTKSAVSGNYSPDAAATFDEYALFPCKALNIKEVTPPYYYFRKGGVDEDYSLYMGRAITRGKAVEMLVATLGNNVRADNNLAQYSLAEMLLQKNVFTREQLDDVAGAVVGSTYDYIKADDGNSILARRVCGVTMAHTATEMRVKSSGCDYTRTGTLAALFADSEKIIYAVDPYTLVKRAAIMELDNPYYLWNHLVILPQYACLFIADTEGRYPSGSLYIYDSSTNALWLALADCCPENLEPYRDYDTPWDVQMTAEGALFCGPYGVMRLNNASGELTRLTETPAIAVCQAEDGVYYVPFIPIEQQAYNHNLLWDRQVNGSQEIWKITESGQASMVYRLDIDKYRMVITGLGEITGGSIRFRSEYFKRTTASYFVGYFEYEVADGKLTVVNVFNRIAELGGEKELLAEQERIAALQTDINP